MCLAVPARIVQLDGTAATVDLHGNRVHISTVLTPGVVLNDWVLVHAGFSIQQLDAAAAAETFSMMKDMGLTGPVADTGRSGGCGGGAKSPAAVGGEGVRRA